MTQESEPQYKKTESKIRILEVVKGPVGLLSLIVLVVEGILGVVVIQLEELHQFYLGLLMLATLLTMVFGVIVAIIKRPALMMPTADEHAGASASLDEVKPHFDVFLAAPMAAFPDNAAFVHFKTELMQVVQVLRGAEFNATVYCAVEKIDSMDMFDRVPVVASADFDLLKRSRWFLMLYPEELATSAIAEAGFALAYRKPSVYLVREGITLPYLLGAAAKDKTINVRSVEFKTIEDIIRELKKTGRQLFAF
jgi:hypothetical protein